jgi:hypothetical protein
MTNFKTLCNARQEKLGKKYLNEDGTNKAFQRNNLKDIIEELADAYNISTLFLERLKDEQSSCPMFITLHLLKLMRELQDGCEEMGMRLLSILECTLYPKELQYENVDRIGFNIDILKLEEE